MDYDLKKILKPVLFLILLIAAATVLLYAACQWEGRPVGLLRCLYMVTITMSTIGYEDMIGTQGSRLLTLLNIALIIVFMLAVAYAVSNFTAYLIEGRIGRYFQMNQIRKRIAAMRDHYIVCGIKDVGFHVAKELYETKRPLVVIDDSRQAIEHLWAEMPKVPALEGDPTSDEMLHKAGIERAQALIAALDNDKENLYLVVAAKDLNSNIVTAAKYNNPATRHKFIKAGASSLVSPNMIGGLRIASELVRPQTVSFLDTMLRNKQEAGTRVEEITIPEGSPLAGRDLVHFYQATGVSAIAFRRAGDQGFTYNPDPRTKLEPGMLLIFIANPDKRRGVEEKIQGRQVSKGSAFKRK